MRTPNLTFARGSRDANALPSRRRGMLAASLTLAVAGTWLSSVPAPGVAAGTTEPPVYGASTVGLKAVGTVTVRDLPAASPVAVPQLVPDSAEPDGGGSSGGGTPAPVINLPTPAGRLGPSAASGPLGPSGSPTELDIIGGINNTGTAPPDTSIGVGPNNIFELVNTQGEVWTKGGGFQRTFSASSFFLSPAISMTNPFYVDGRVYYDAVSGRWFASDLIVDTSNNNSDVRVAMSWGSDPNGTWSVWSAGSNTSGILYDQPKLGVNDDKVTLTWNIINNGIQGESVVFDKGNMISGGTVFVTTFAPDPAHYDVIPVRSLTSTTTEYAANIQPNSSTLAIFAFNGKPSAGNVSYTVTNLGVGVANNSPGAVEPGTTTNLEVTGAGIQSAEWRNGTLWAVGNDSCVPGGDSTARACVRLEEVSTSGSPSVQLDTNLANSGAYDIYPAVVTDGSGDVYLGMTYTSSSTYPSAYLVELQNGSTSAISGYLWAQGSGTYLCEGNVSLCNNRNRFGDYSEAAVDPNDDGDVWLADEYGSTSSTDSSQWATAISEDTLNGPTVTSISPTSGSTEGGTAVDVFGQDLGAFGSVSFGGVQSPSMVFIDSTHVRATTPAHGAGQVAVTATTNRGTSSSFGAPLFNYVVPPTVTGISPPLGLTLLSESVTITGSGFFGTTSVTFGGVPAFFTVQSNSQIVASSPIYPTTSIGFVDVQVTANGATSDVTSADRFLYL
jgi:hypothetical protein